MTDTFIVVAGKPTITKDPQAVLDYVVNFNDWLSVFGGTLASVSATASGGVVVDSAVVTPSDISFTADGVTTTVPAGKGVLLWVSGGVVATPASITLHVTSTGSPARVDDRTIYFKIKQR